MTQYTQEATYIYQGQSKNARMRDLLKRNYLRLLKKMEGTVVDGKLIECVEIENPGSLFTEVRVSGRDA